MEDAHHFGCHHSLLLSPFCHQVYTQPHTQYRNIHKRWEAEIILNGSHAPANLDIPSIIRQLTVPYSYIQSLLGASANISRCSRTAPVSVLQDPHLSFLCLNICMEYSSSMILELLLLVLLIPHCQVPKPSELPLNMPFKCHTFSRIVNVSWLLSLYVGVYVRDMYVQVGIFVDIRGCCLLYFLVTLYLRFWFRFGCVTESLVECRAQQLD